MTEAYGQRLGEALRVENAPAIVTRALRTADIAVTEIRCDNPLPEMSGSIQQEDAFLVALQLRDFPTHKYWEDGRQAPVCDLRAGESCLYDLKRDPAVLLDKPYHSLHFYLPRAALDAIADDANAPRIRDLSYEPGAGVNDVTISGLGSLLLPALSHPDQANPLFVDHVLLAVGVHIAQTYGGMRPMSRPVRGGLAPWQERRARETAPEDIELKPMSWWRDSPSQEQGAASLEFLPTFSAPHRRGDRIGWLVPVLAHRVGYSGAAACPELDADRK
jgi:AraC family transcriptional regulator